LKSSLTCVRFSKILTIIQKLSSKTSSFQEKQKMDSNCAEGYPTPQLLMTEAWIITFCTEKIHLTKLIVFFISATYKSNFTSFSKQTSLQFCKRCLKTMAA
jgi:hypothetical protein